MADFVVGDFEWRVQGGAFRVVQGTPQDAPEDKLVNPWDPSQEFVCPAFPDAPALTYQPLADHTGLFLTFADTNASDDATGFADLYGWLGVATYSVKRDGSDEEPRGEPVAVWVREVEAMRRAVGQWEKTADGDLKATPPDAGTMESANLRLAGGLSGGLHSSLGGMPVLAFRPTSLLSAIWFQFALAAAEKKTFRRCDVCRTWFEVATGAGRVDKRFCSDSCRSKKYRSRQDMARLLFEGGKSVEFIAKLLRSEPKVIRGWVRGVKKGKE